ncbi:hypothetical protein P7C71_g3725, partial [Lecanoromycetidae sp. Uapishka_2]
MPQIHWSAPTLMVASLIVGILFALCHHLFYASLDCKPASTSLEGYDVLGTHVSIQHLNLAAPMAEYGTTGSEDGAEPGLAYMYAGPSLTVQRITDAVAAQGLILPVAAPSVNSTWDLDFNGPSLHCNPVSSGFQDAVLANILNYTFARSQNTMEANCSYGPGYMAWHPGMMTPNTSMTEYLPFNIDDLNSSTGALNNDNSHGYPYSDMASVFLAIAPTLFSSVSAEGYDPPTMCLGKPWYQAGLARYHNTSTVLRCDLHNSTYHTTFSFVNGVQEVNINNVTDVTNTPMITIGEVVAYLNSSDQTDMSLRPQACPPANSSDSDGVSSGCLFDPVTLSTLSYQAVMHAFTDLVAGMISLGDAQDLQTLITSTTQLTSTVLAEAPELAFLQSTRTQNQNTPPSVQQRAAMWNQQPFAGLVNAAAESKATLPFQQALEQLFQNITMSLMSAPELQPNTSSIYYPNKTKVQLATSENIYIYAAYKLWLAYGLAIGATALIALFGMVAILANHASFSNKFSTILRLSRGAQLSYEINHADLGGQDPLPAYAKKTTVRFSQEQMLATRDSNAYTLVDREGKDDEHEVTTQERQSEQS